MSVFDAYVRLEGTLDGTLRYDEPMSRHTSYCIGGPADLFVECATLPDLALTCDVLADVDVSFTVVGKGSNLLVSDQGYRGAILVLSGQFANRDFGANTRRIEEGDAFEEGEEVCVTVGAAYSLSRLVQEAYHLGLSGLEAMTGIPGTLGGALFMNAGTRTQWIGSRVLDVTVYRHGVGLCKLAAADLEWGYRTSSFREGDFIVEATLVLEAASKEQVASSMQRLLDVRLTSQPLAARCCGSVFKNPPGRSSGKLIRDCGLAGATCGDACISTRHANFIVNDGSARANDVLALMRLARDRVKETYGIRLTPEVRFLGFPF